MPYLPKKLKFGFLQQAKGLVAASHGVQSEPTDGTKGGWNCVFWCSGHLNPQLLDVVRCSVV